MADIDLKTLTPDTSLPTTGFLFGADSQATASPSVYAVTTAITAILGNAASSDALVFNSDTTFSRGAIRNFRFGAADAATALAQTLSVQSVVAGTSNTAGAAFTIKGSQGTGTGAGGSIIFQVAPAGGSGTAQNALADTLTLGSGEMKIGIGGSPLITLGHSSASASARIGFFSGVQLINSTLGGVSALRLSTGALNDVGGIQFGGTTSSFPALKRSTTFLQARLADDTGFTGFAAANVQAATAYTVATLPGTPGTGMIARVSNALAPAIGATVAAGGAAYALVNYNGANWTVIGV